MINIIKINDEVYIDDIIALRKEFMMDCINDLHNDQCKNKSCDDSKLAYSHESGSFHGCYFAK